MKENDDITLITAFYDIGRGNWNNEFKRSNAYYIESFLQYLKYPYKMICFIDDRYIDEILVEYSKSVYQNKMFIPIDREWLIKNTHAWQNYDREHTIITSESYQSYLKDNRMKLIPVQAFDIHRNIDGYLFPENVFPEYNLINHAKIDFIAYVKKCGYIQTSMTCWCDFGFFYSQCKRPDMYPKDIIDVNKLQYQKITMLLSKQIHDNDYNMLYTLTIAPELFRGSFYSIPTHMIERMQKLYHECLDELYDNNIADDDQHVYIRCLYKSIQRNDDIFNLIVEEKIPALVLFSK